MQFNLVILNHWETINLVLKQDSISNHHISYQMDMFETSKVNLMNQILSNFKWKI